MDVFVVVIFDDRSVVPNEAHTFSTLAKAKEYAQSTTTDPEATFWEEWAEGKFVFGYGKNGEEVEEPIAAVYGSELDTAVPD